ncbi:hypothetical protein GQ55_1G303300 [Panicum hallii var. hallii]|uniref:Late embryogenesis abundant protein LEA-2 subgroup domain-containing protein n=1 Tax=Panicum hallii var. hallii TaxID=1504633 RepID=A0A2T7F940_9POAL|nr:hypothetical protein GQ55_1G303300 [Panicum hallii var. hallii]
MGAHARGTDERLLDDEDGGGGGGCDQAMGFFMEILPGVLGTLLAIVIMVPLLYYPYQWSFDNGKYPEYSVAVAGFSGFDPARAVMDPTFDLTVRIKEPRKWSTACVERGTAVVSYRGARLASGPVPGFCGRNENTTEVSSVMAWGTGVPVPQFARDRLADELGRGEAAVDVVLMGPVRHLISYVQTVIECKPRLGRGEASPPCWVRDDVPTLPADPARRPQQARKQLRTPQ